MRRNSSLIRLSARVALLCASLVLVACSVGIYDDNCVYGYEETVCRSYWYGEECETVYHEACRY